MAQQIICEICIFLDSHILQVIVPHLTESYSSQVRIGSVVFSCKCCVCVCVCVPLSKTLLIRMYPTVLSSPSLPPSNTPYSGPGIRSALHLYKSA